MGEWRELIRRYFAAFGARDIDAALACIHPDAIWHVDGDPGVVTAGIIRGRDAVRHWLQRFPEGFHPLAFSVDHLIGDGADVMALGRFRHRVRPTGAIVDSDYAIRFTVRDGLIARYQIFEDSLLIASAQHSADCARQGRINGTIYGWGDIGSGPPVIFLHGLFLDRHFWTPLIDRLGHNRRLVTFDMPGHGSSTWRDGLDLDGIAEDIALWIMENGAGPAAIVGHSQGGMIAMRIAARFPDAVKRLVLVNTSARAEYPERIDAWQARRAALLAGDGHRVRALRDVQRLTTAPDLLKEHLEDAAQELKAMAAHDPTRIVSALDAAVLQRPDIRALLPRIRAPVDVLSGELDRATPPTLGEEIAASIPQGRHTIITRAAHHLPTEQPAALVTFLHNG